MTKTLLAMTAVAGLAGAVYWLWFFGDEPAQPASRAEQTDWSAALQSLSAEGFERPTPDWTLSLPLDHGAHPKAQTENWQISFHLRTAQGAPLGLQFSLMRLGVVSPEAPPQDSIWEIRELYRGHMTLLGDGAETATGEERLARGLPGLVGYDKTEQSLRMDNWVLQFVKGAGTPEMKLVATVQDDTVVELSLRPGKAVVALEPEGAEAPFVGYAFPRLVVDGTIRQAQNELRVSGTAWLDHSWGDLPIPGAGPVSWDRVQFQLDDGTDVSILRARRTNGRGAATINGLVIGPEGAITTFDEDDVRMRSTRTWQHPETGTEYPVAWQIEGIGIDVALEPLQDAQLHDFTMPFWSGVVVATGQWNAHAVSGLGTMQLTGYADG